MRILTILILFTIFLTALLASGDNGGGKENTNYEIMGHAKGGNVKKSKTEEGIANANEKTLINYLTKDRPAVLKWVAIRKIFQAYSPNGQKHLKQILQMREITDLAKTLIVRYLTKRAILAKKGVKQLAVFFRTLYFQTNHIAIKQALIVAIARLEKKSSVAILKELRNKIWQKQWRDEISRLKYLEYRGFITGLKRMRPDMALRRIMRAGGISNKIIKKLEQIGEARTRSVESKRFLFATLRVLHPRADYYQLKKIVLNKPFWHRRFFTTLLKIIFRKYGAKGMRLLALRKVWGLRYYEALIVYRFYQSKIRLFKEINL